LEIKRGALIDVLATRPACKPLREFLFKFFPISLRLEHDVSDQIVSAPIAVDGGVNAGVGLERFQHIKLKVGVLWYILEDACDLEFAVTFGDRLPDRILGALKEFARRRFAKNHCVGFVEHRGAVAVKKLIVEHGEESGI